MLRITKPPPPCSMDINEKNPFQDIQDLELAAELGRTLLERNAELENEMKGQQAIMDDQAQEIEFLTKQNSTMKEEAATRSKFYEQLESTIFELERTNSQLSRKHEVDKKRIQSLCENIDYLERKCEEMTGTLETIRDESKKNYGTGKMSRSSYLSYTGSDSSEDDSFTFFKRRSHSLHDLRDFTPSPDEFDSNNSHSPELKVSENEFIESLESKIEQLLSARKKEQDKIQQMEAQMRILIQENANLQEQLNLVQTEKEEQIRELRKQLLDTSNYAQQTLSMASQVFSSSQPPLNNLDGKSHSSSSMSSQSPHDSGLENNWSHSPLASSIVLNHGNQNESQEDSVWKDFHKSSDNAIHFQFSSCTTPANVLCKRCSAEIKLLNLVNSIEVEDDDETDNLNIDGDDFNSLEHELARATGHHNSLSYSSRRRQSLHNNKNKNKDNSSDNSDSSSNGGHDSNWPWGPWGIRRPSLLLDLFRDREEEIGEEACEIPIDPPANYPKSLRSIADVDDDEDPWLRKDGGKEKTNGLCRRRNGNKKFKFTKLQLPQKIPVEDEEEGKNSFYEDNNKLSPLSNCTDCSNIEEDEKEKGDTLSLATNQIEEDEEEEKGTEVMKKKVKLSPEASKKKKGIAVHFQMDNEEEEAEEAFSDACDCGFNCSDVKISVSTPCPCPPVSVFLTPVPASETIEEEASNIFSALSSISSELSSSCPPLMDNSLSSSSSLSSQSLRNSMVPEYKMILDKMFNLFQISRETYPAPAYPFIAQARR